AGLHPLVDLASASIPAVNDCIIAQKSWVEANRDVMQKFMDGLMEAKPRLKKDKAYTVDLIKKWLKDEDTRKAEESYDYYLRIIPDEPYPKAENFRDALETLATQNPVAKGFDVSKIVDPSFVKSAVDRGI